MSRLFFYFVGPELFWVLVCLLVHKATRRGLAPNPAITSWLDDHWGWLPFIFVPLTFICFLVPETGRWWLLLRADLAIAIGLVIATTSFCNGMTYHQPSSGPGVGTAFLVIPIFGYTLAAFCTLITAIVLWRRARGQA